MIWHRQKTAAGSGRAQSEPISHLLPAWAVRLHHNQTVRGNNLIRGKWADLHK